MENRHTQRYYLDALNSARAELEALASRRKRLQIEIDEITVRIRSVEIVILPLQELVNLGVPECPPSKS